MKKIFTSLVVLTSATLFSCGGNKPSPTVYYNISFKGTNCKMYDVVEPFGEVKDKNFEAGEIAKFQIKAESGYVLPKDNQVTFTGGEGATYNSSTGEFSVKMTEDVVVSAVADPEDPTKPCKIIWDVGDGEEHIDYYDVGDTPKYEGTPTKLASTDYDSTLGIVGETTYQFSKWDKTIVPAVEGTTTYTAIYDEEVMPVTKVVIKTLGNKDDTVVTFSCDGDYYVNWGDPQSVKIKEFEKLSHNQNTYTYHNEKNQNFEIIIFGKINKFSICNVGDNVQCVNYIYIGSSVTEIDENAFKGLRSLLGIYIPDSVKFVNKNILNDGAYDTTVIFCKNKNKPDKWDEEWDEDGRQNKYAVIWDTDEIGVAGDFTYAVINYLDKPQTILAHYINSNDSVEIPSSIVTPHGEKSINGAAATLYGQSKVISINFKQNNSFIYVGSYAFSQTGIASIDLPETTKVIDYRSFFICNNLAEVDFGSNLCTIGEEAFYGCEKLTKLNFPSTLQTIGIRAFASCPLEQITLPEGLISISTGAFGVSDSDSGLIVDATKFTVASKIPTGTIDMFNEKNKVTVNISNSVTEQDFLSKGWPNSITYTQAS